MEPQKITTDAEYREALGRIDEIFQARPGTPEGHELELLVLQVEEYEDRVYPIDPPEFDSVREFARNRSNP